MRRKATHYTSPGAAALAAARLATASLLGLRREGRLGRPQGPRTLRGLAPWCVVKTDGQPVRARLNQQIFESQI